MIKTGQTQLELQLNCERWSSPDHVTFCLSRDLSGPIPGSFSTPLPSSIDLQTLWTLLESLLGAPVVEMLGGY